MKISFTKMQALGNDFVVIDSFSAPFEPTTKQIQQLTDRHYGIGCDQLLLLSPAVDKKADLLYRIFNQDGSEVAQCGNGARCVALYLEEQGIICKPNIIAQTYAGIITLYRMGKNLVKVNMGIPEFTAVTKDTIDNMVIVSLGNPHAILETAEIKEATEVARIGSQMQQLDIFPDGVNVGFMWQQDRDNINLRTYERGVGETLACGSNACAAVAAGIYCGYLAKTVNVNMLGGVLTISWQGQGESIWMTGAAEIVFTGEINL